MERGKKMSERLTQTAAPMYMTSADLAGLFQISLREAQYMMNDFDREHKVIRFGRALRVDIRYVAELMCQHELGARKVDKMSSIREWLKQKCEAD